MSEIGELGRDLQAAGPEIGARLTQAFVAGGKRMERGWSRNAVGTARRHGKHYPKSIQSTLMAAGAAPMVKVEPNAGMPQGGMSFEYGSRNQPPHLDAHRAFPAADAYLSSASDRAVYGAIP